MRIAGRIDSNPEAWILLVASLGALMLALWALGHGCSQVSSQLPGLVVGSDSISARGWRESGSNP